MLTITYIIKTEDHMTLENVFTFITHEAYGCEWKGHLYKISDSHCTLNK